MTRYKAINHTSKFEITGSKSNLLKDKRIAIGMCGSVAVLEMITTSRLLMRHGAEIFVFMSKAAIELVNPNLVEWATGNPVITELTGQVEHVHLGGEHEEKVDLILLAPTTANTIGKIASGIDDTPVTTLVTTALGTKIPILIVPAMHKTMYDNPIVIKNINNLKELGFNFIEPRIEDGKAKICNSEEIVERVVSTLTKKDLTGKAVVITAGPTRVWIDDVRFISNPSSGKMGIELALEAKARGANVKLIIGPTSENIYNREIDIIKIETPQDIIEEIKSLDKLDLFISAAAISDYSPIKVEGKIQSKSENLVIKLQPTPKILSFARKSFPNAKLIGFKAECNITNEELKNRAQKRIKDYNLDLIVANFIHKEKGGFGSSTNEVFIINKNGKSLHVPLSSKREVSSKILDQIINA